MAERHRLMLEQRRGCLLGSLFFLQNDEKGATQLVIEL